MRLSRHGKVITISTVAIGVLALSQAPAYSAVTNLHASGCAGNGDHTRTGSASFVSSLISGTPSCYLTETRIEGFNPGTGRTTWYYGQVSQHESYVSVSNGDYLEAFQGRVANRAGNWGPWTNLTSLS